MILCYDAIVKSVDGLRVEVTINMTYLNWWLIITEYNDINYNSSVPKLFSMN